MVIPGTQKGRVSLRVPKRCHQLPAGERPASWLQWSRSFSAAETTLLAVKTVTSGCFNGAAASQLRKPCLHGPPGMWYRASMEPQLLSCGNAYESSQSNHQ